MAAARQKLSWLLRGWYLPQSDRDARTVRASQLFDPDWYLQQNPDVRAAGVDPLEHYLQSGASEGRDPNALFSTKWYLEQNVDVGAAGVNPLVHYLNWGAAEGRDPHPSFDSDWYLTRNPDVWVAGINPLVHYLKWGAAEGRSSSPLAPVERSNKLPSHPKTGGPALSVGDAGPQEELELQLYLLRSDHQRTVNLAERLRSELANAERALNALKCEKDEWLANRSEIERQLAASEQAGDNAMQAFDSKNRENEALQQTLEVQKQEKEVLLTDMVKLERRLADSERTSQNALTALKHEKEAILATTANIDRRLSESERNHATGADLELYQARLLSRLSVVTAEVVGLRRTLQPSGGSGSTAPAKMRTRYLDLLENMLTGRLYEDSAISPWSREYNADVRLMGRDWPEHAETMIGVARMRNIRLLAENVIEDKIPGDFLEAGVWRGGACIYMRGILAAYDNGDRKVWVADSFAGLPPPNPELYPADEGDPHHTFKELIVPLEEVEANFAKYDLLDDQVMFLAGWFKDTLPAAPIEKLAILRLDGDMYESTMDTLQSLYPKVAPGGYVIIDDYLLTPCKKAVDDFRGKNNIIEPLQDIDGAAVYWRKESAH